MSAMNDNVIENRIGLVNNPPQPQPYKNDTRVNPTLNGFTSVPEFRDTRTGKILVENKSIRSVHAIKIDLPDGRVLIMSYDDLRKNIDQVLTVCLTSVETAEQLELTTIYNAKSPEEQIALNSLPYADRNHSLNRMRISEQSNTVHNNRRGNSSNRKPLHQSDIVAQNPRMTTAEFIANHNKKPLHA